MADTEFAENLSLLNRFLASGFLLGNKRDCVRSLTEVRDVIVIVTDSAVYRVRDVGPPVEFYVEKIGYI